MAVYPVTHPRVWPAMPQEDARPELLMEASHKQVLGQQLLSATGAESAAKLFSHLVLATSFLSPLALTHGDFLYPGTTHLDNASSQLESLLAVTVVRIF